MGKHLFFAVSIFLAGCAATPTENKTANIDYCTIYTKLKSNSYRSTAAVSGIARVPVNEQCSSW